MEGDKLETSGMGGIYPKGIGIGKVIEVVNKKNPIEKVTLFKMKYLKKEVMSILSDRRKVIAATRIQSQSLFD